MELLIKYPILMLSPVLLMLILTGYGLCLKLDKTWTHYDKARLQSHELKDMALEISRQQGLYEALNKQLSQTEAPQQELFVFSQHLAKLCKEEKVRLITLPFLNQSATGSQRVHFCLQGPFSRLLNILYQLEHQSHIGRLVYLKFEKQAINVQGKRLNVLRVQASLRSSFVESEM